MSLVRSGQNQAADAVSDFHFVEVDEQTQWNIEQLHITQKFSFVDRQGFFDRLGFHEHAVLNQDVEAQRLFTRESLVFDQHRFLAHAGKAAQFKLSQQTPLID